MGEQDRAVHEISDARTRLSELATELSRRMEKERVKEFASEKATEFKERAKSMASEKATELKHQAREAASDKASEYKDRAREAVMTKTTQFKEQADSPKGWSLLGAILGAGVGAVLMKKAFDARQQHDEGDGRLSGRQAYGGDWRDSERLVHPYDTHTPVDTARRAPPTGGPQGLSMGGEAGFEQQGGASVKDKAADKASELKGKASDMKDRAMHKASELKERVQGHMPSGGELRGRGSQLRGQAMGWFERTLHEQPLLLAMGGLAVGMVASSVMPVTRRERRLIEPARHRMEERISEFGERINEKLRGDSGSEESEERQGSEERSSRIPPLPPLPPLDDTTPKVH